MFENTSQGMFVTSFLVYRALPVLKILASILMSISVYRHAKSNKINRKGMWALVVFGFPVLGRLAYCVYHRYIRKKGKEYLFEQDTTNNRKGALMCVLSLILSAVAGIISVASIATMGVSVIKSIVDDEYLFEHTCYDVNGNQYSDTYDVPLYDENGNRYNYQSLIIGVGNYTDQNGKEYDLDLCYLNSLGYFIYDENQELLPCDECWCNYYYDNQENKYYKLEGYQIYWDEDGNMYEIMGRYTNLLFDEE